MVMVGSLFAGHEQSPGATVEVDGRRYKEYSGSASDFNKGEYEHVEGKRILEPFKGRLEDTLREMHEDLQSSISYAGGRVLAELKKVPYVILGGENAGEHLFMQRTLQFAEGMPSLASCIVVRLRHRSQTVLSSSHQSPTCCDGACADRRPV